MKYKIFMVLTILCIGFSSCEKKLDELNFDPTVLTEVDLRLMLPEVITQSVFNAGANQNRIAGIVTNQLRGIDAQQLQYTNYVIGADVLNNYWNTGLYAGALRSCQVIIDQATEEGAPFYSGVAKILMANQLGIATSMFGDIPFNEALKGSENLKPTYDSQESVYASVQRLLDEAIAEISKDGYAGGDLIYGNVDIDQAVASWIATARALKARYLMHTYNRNSGAATAALTQLDLAFPEAAQPAFTFGTSETQNWSLAKFGLERPSTLMFHESFAAMLENDPRLAVYSTFDGTFWQYFGAGLKWAQSDATVPLISYVEVKFLEAEALARTGGDATGALADAIQASFDLVGVDEAGYVAANSDLSGLDANGVLGKIMTEAYKSYYGFNFHETWTNFRRTGFPALTASPDGSNGFNPSGIIPLRYQYTESETSTNSENVEAAQGRQGGALLDAGLWAFE